MSESILTASPSGPKVSKVSEAIIRIAGNSQDGIQAIGGFLARLAGRSEQEVMTFMTIHLIPGDPARVLLGEEATPQTLAALRKNLFDSRRTFDSLGVISSYNCKL